MMGSMSSGTHAQTAIQDTAVKIDAEIFETLVFYHYNSEVKIQNGDAR